MEQATKNRRPRGRPTTYTPEIAQHICDRIADGEPLRQICREEGMPAWRTVYQWLAAHDDFYARFMRARDIGCDAIAEDSMAIVDEPPERGPDGKVDPGWVNLQRIRAEHRLKLLAKWHPKRYGDKVDVNHGGQPENPLTLLLQQVQGTGLKPVSDDDEG